ncbi:hypothetical protein Hanom_Chr04g00332171 [Helianthus anomalus]
MLQIILLQSLLLIKQLHYKIMNFILNTVTIFNHIIIIFFFNDVVFVLFFVAILVVL